MNNAPALVRRIVLRLDPGRPTDGRLAAAARLAAALHAELAARLVSDTRIESALGFANAVFGEQKTTLTASSVETIVRRAETTLRQSVSMFAERERAVWSFEVVHCAGALAGNIVDAEDLVAIELARLETIPSDLRAEVAAALDRARGVILFPSAAYPQKGPVVAITSDHRDEALLDVGRRIAAAMGEPLTVLAHGIAYDAAGFATAIRKQKAVLTIADTADALVQEFLRRPRFLRELATPLLLLKSQS